MKRSFWDTCTSATGRIFFFCCYFKFSRQSFAYRKNLRFEVFIIFRETYLNTSFSKEKNIRLELKLKNCSKNLRFKHSLQMRHGNL